MNEILFFVSLLINFVGILAFWRLWGKSGLFCWVAFGSVIANIEVLKCVDIFGLSLTLGNVMYGTIFLATDILSEIYGGKTARKAVVIGFGATLVFSIVTQVTLLYEPNTSDYASGAMATLFSIMPRIFVASLTAFIVSNTMDTYLYDGIRKKFPADRFLWVRNNGSTLTSQMVDTVIFFVVAFWGVMSPGEIIEISAATYIIKVIISLCDTPFVYLAKRIGVKHYAD